MNNVYTLCIHSIYMYVLEYDMYVHVCIRYVLYLSSWIHSVKAVFGHIEWITSRTHDAPAQF